MNKSYQERLTPIMGWASWNNYHTEIDETLLKKQIDALISTGLAAAGYNYVNIDDGFFGGRDADGRVRAHPRRFPNGMKVVADYAHQRGLQAGIYSDGGSNTCAHVYDNPDNNTDGVGVGLFGFDEQDLRMYLIDWDYDFIKVDWCGGIRLGLDERERYTEIARIIEKIKLEKNRDVIFNVCRWEFPGDWVIGIADSWRVSGDITLDFSSVLRQLDAVKPLSIYHGPGHVNDLDMLQVGRGLSYEEDKSHFAMWCMMSTPLMLGNDLTTISAETLSILKNRELIELNQDPGCCQAIPLHTQGNCEIWVKRLGLEGSHQRAIAVLNRGETAENVVLNWEEFGFSPEAEIRDITNQISLPYTENFAIEVPSHGTRVFKLISSRRIGRSVRSEKGAQE